MEIAIEFGGSEFRSLRRESGRLLARRVSTDYLVVQGDETRLRLLERQVEEYARCDEGMIVYGPGALDLADLLGLPLQSALDQGHIREEDPVSRQFLGALVDGLLPSSTGQGLCTVIATGDAEESDYPTGDSLSFLLQLVKLRGYEPLGVSPGLALALAECGGTSYSGIGVKLGAARIDVSVVHQTHERIQFSIPRGGEHLDRELARRDDRYLRLRDGREVLDTRPIRLWRQGVRNLNQISDPRTLDLRNQYRDLAYVVLHRLQQELTPRLLRTLPGQLPLIVGGMLAAPSGTELLFQQAAREVQLPLQLSDIRRVRDVAYSALRGGLIAGEIAMEQSKASSAA
ncbi:MAG: hypothetical protein R3C12_06335 [Planctomycetaceae bacterium]|nr:hypothetical protein [Planctomycetaceae bacterium]